jgi:hypothetical protein
MLALFSSPVLTLLLGASPTRMCAPRTGSIALQQRDSLELPADPNGHARSHSGGALFSGADCEGAAVATAVLPSSPPCAAPTATPATPAALHAKAADCQSCHTLVEAEDLLYGAGNEALDAAKREWLAKRFDSDIRGIAATGAEVVRLAGLDQTPPPPSPSPPAFVSREEAAKRAWLAKNCAGSGVAKGGGDVVYEQPAAASSCAREEAGGVWTAEHTPHAPSSEWTTDHTPEGHVFWHNYATGESSWYPPEATGEEAREEATDEVADEEADEVAEEVAEEAAEEAVAAGCPPEEASDQAAVTRGAQRRAAARRRVTRLRATRAACRCACK